MVMEAQIESGTFVSQNTGGPFNVTKMLAATSKNLFSVPMTSAKCRFANCTVPICRKVKIPVQAHSNATCDVENDDILIPANALKEVCASQFGY